MGEADSSVAFLLGGKMPTGQTTSEQEERLGSALSRLPPLSQPIPRVLLSDSSDHPLLDKVLCCPKFVS